MDCNVHCTGKSESAVWALWNAGSVSGVVPHPQPISGSNCLSCILHGPLSWDEFSTPNSVIWGEGTNKTGQVIRLSPWERLGTISNRGSYCLIRDIKVPAMGTRNLKSGHGKFSHGKLLCRDKIQLGTPIDCLNFPSGFLLGVCMPLIWWHHLLLWYSFKWNPHLRARLCYWGHQLTAQQGFPGSFYWMFWRPDLIIFCYLFIYLSIYLSSIPIIYHLPIPIYLSTYPFIYHLYYLSSTHIYFHIYHTSIYLLCIYHLLFTLLL